MKVNYMKDDALQIIKSNQKEIYDAMVTNKNNWLNDFLGEDYLGESKIEIKPFDFKMHEDNPIDSDFENAKIIFESFKHLNETQASDERFWTGLAFTIGHEYLVYRWGLEELTRFKYRWIFYTQNRRALFYHGLARLWWFAKLTYDENRQDPYELTKFAYSNSEIMKNMVYRNFSNSKHIRISILQTLMKFEQAGGTIDYKTLVELYKYVSLLGGVYLLDAMSTEELEEKLFVKLFELNK